MSASELQEVKKKLIIFNSKFEDQEDAMNDLKRKFNVVEGMANAAQKSSSKRRGLTTTETMGWSSRRSGVSKFKKA